MSLYECTLLRTVLSIEQVPSVNRYFNYHSSLSWKLFTFHGNVKKMLTQKKQIMRIKQKKDHKAIGSVYDKEFFFKIKGNEYSGVLKNTRKSHAFPEMSYL